ncbi:MAG: hypothetical protein ACRDRI_05280 [Pseudonocardiaceae bacterium]
MRGTRLGGLLSGTRPPGRGIGEVVSLRFAALALVTWRIAGFWTADQLARVLPGVAPRAFSQPEKWIFTRLK